MALGSFDVYKPSPAAQRRLARILREIDPHAVEKLLLWESVHREAAAAEQGGDPSKLNRLRMRVAARVKELDKQAVSRDGRLGGGGGKVGDWVLHHRIFRAGCHLAGCLSSATSPAQYVVLALLPACSYLSWPQIASIPGFPLKNRSSLRSTLTGPKTDQAHRKLFFSVPIPCARRLIRAFSRCLLSTLTCQPQCLRRSAATETSGLQCWRQQWWAGSSTGAAGTSTSSVCPHTPSLKAGTCRWVGMPLVHC
jgi:hypothetical protein